MDQREELWRLPVKLLLPTKNELGGSLDPNEKDVFAVNAKALINVRQILTTKVSVGDGGSAY